MRYCDKFDRRGNALFYCYEYKIATYIFVYEFYNF